MRAGSVADDIGCWTAHGATDRISLPAYTAAFLEGYRHSNDLPAADAAAVPFFQRLRIASRACYVTDPDALAGTRAWMQYAFADGRRMGRFAVSGDSLEFHLLFVQTVIDRYRHLVTACEQKAIEWTARLL